jgi:hypothetical protein
MEIDETFSSLEEIEARLEKDGMTWRISVDEDIGEEDGHSNIRLDSADAVSFATDADALEIEKWEAELPDEKEEDEEDKDELFEENILSGRIPKADIEAADVVYFDIFKKKTYMKTLIFCPEKESGAKIYRLVGFCEAPIF